MGNKIYWRKFGIEFEFSSLPKEVVRQIRPLLKEIYGRKAYRHSTDWIESKRNTLWHIKPDSSTDVEVCTPISTFEDLNTIVFIISNLDLEITNNDGLHIHMQADDINPYQMAIGWILIEKLLFNHIPRYRRSNEYCKRVTNFRHTNCLFSKIINQVIRDLDDHHSALSTNKWEERGTVELRIFRNFRNPRYIKPSVQFLARFLHYCSRIDTNYMLCTKIKRISSFEKLLKEIPLNKEIQSFLLDKSK
ncbi:MAG: amidoligase family protein [Petrotogales bacterium]